MRTKKLIELVTKYLIKFEKEIDGYFSSLRKDGFAYIKNAFSANAQSLHVKMGLHILKMLSLQMLRVCRLGRYSRGTG